MAAMLGGWWAKKDGEAIAEKLQRLLSTLDCLKWPRNGTRRPKTSSKSSLLAEKLM